MKLNLTSVMGLTRALALGMKERRWGRIINIASIMATVSKEGRNGYSATKTALLGLTRACALDLGPFGVTVNCLSPGPFLTELPGKLLSPGEKAAFAAHTAVAAGESRKNWLAPRCCWPVAAGRTSQAQIWLWMVVIFAVKGFFAEILKMRYPLVRWGWKGGFHGFA